MRSHWKFHPPMTGQPGLVHSRVQWLHYFETGKIVRWRIIPLWFVVESNPTPAWFLSVICWYRTSMQYWYRVPPRSLSTNVTSHKRARYTWILSLYLRLYSRRVSLWGCEDTRLDAKHINIRLHACYGNEPESRLTQSTKSSNEIPYERAKYMRKPWWKTLIVYNAMPKKAMQFTWFMVTRERLD